MKTLTEISDALRASLQHRDLTQAQLRALAGISQRTLTNVLSGQDDFKVSTLMAIADRLGLELLLVPKGAAGVLTTGEPTLPAVRSRVQTALDKVSTARDGAE